MLLASFLLRCLGSVILITDLSFKSYFLRFPGGHHRTLSISHRAGATTDPRGAREALLHRPGGIRAGLRQGEYIRSSKEDCDWSVCFKRFPKARSAAPKVSSSFRLCNCSGVAAFGNVLQGHEEDPESRVVRSMVQQAELLRGDGGVQGEQTGLIASTVSAPFIVPSFRNAR